MTSPIKSNVASGNDDELTRSETAMAHPSVDKFGELIINSLRDNAIEHFDLMAAQHYATPDL